MILIRLLTIQGMKHNVRIFAKYVPTKINGIADSLSRGQWSRFMNLTRKMNMEKFPTEIPEEIWPIQKIWKD